MQEYNIENQLATLQTSHKAAQLTCTGRGNLQHMSEFSNLGLAPQYQSYLWIAKLEQTGVIFLSDTLFKRDLNIPRQ